jgi:hypothetical protein
MQLQKDLNATNYAIENLIRSINALVIYTESLEDKSKTVPAPISKPEEKQK